MGEFVLEGTGKWTGSAYTVMNILRYMLFLRAYLLIVREASLPRTL